MSCFTDIENKPDDWLVLDPLTIQKPIPKTGCDTNLIVLNYLSEFKTDALKLKVRENLGIFTDTILSKNSNNSIANKVVYEEFDKIKGHIGLNSINWTINSDMNNYTKEGTYLIKGERTRQDDNLPILNNGIISAQLIIINSENVDNLIITQILSLNNNVGGEGNVYIRSCQNGEWKAWGKLQTNIEVGQVNTLDHLTDNGIYSGVFTDGTPTSVGTFYDTFVLIVINNYAVSIPTGNPQSISQLKYSLGLNGSISISSRKRDQYGYWDEWEAVKGGSDIDVTAIYNAITAESQRAQTMEQQLQDWMDVDKQELRTADAEIKANAMQYNTLGVNVYANKAEIYGRSIDGNPRTVEFPAATTEKAGVMSALDKRKLDAVDSGATTIVWSASSNMNDFKTPGIYDIYGERTVRTDNLPITNDGSGHSIAARLTVVASTLQPANTEICITQFLQLSNRVGGDGATYVRTYNENNNSMNGWSPWQKQMGMVETIINSNDATVGQNIFSGTTQKIGNGLNGMTDNGMYSGIYTDALQHTSSGNNYWLNTTSVTYLETFVLVVINDYAASGKLNLPRHITQLKYAVDAITGQSTVKKRVGTGNEIISWGDWSDIGGGSAQEVDVTDAVKAEGLPTLVSQGLVNINTLYTALINGSQNLPKLDVNDKIKTFLMKYHNGSALVFKFYLEKIKIYDYFIYVIKCYASNSKSGFQYYHFVVNNNLSEVSLTENSTILE